MKDSKRYISDFLVIGSGIAGLSFAIKASSHGSVNIVTKKKDTDSSTNYAQGGIAAVVSGTDSFLNHIKDTLVAGAGLCNEKAVEIMVKSAPERIAELVEWGAGFSFSGKGEFDLGREGGHSMNRIVHAKDLTGREIERALLDKISRIKNIHLYENSTAVDLLTEHQLDISGKKIFSKEKTHCSGAYILDNATGTVNTFNAKITFIASGGAGQVYLHTTNPDIATGDGIAMAYRAGALIADMEFFQFHPTSLYSNKKTGAAFLISEAVRGEGAILLDSRGNRFMENAHPLKELAPRDIVARAIDRELKKFGDYCVYLDISFKGKEFLEKRFPNIFNKCMQEGIDISKKPIPVVPAAHYLCGGIVSDTNGRTTIQNLYVSGESACTGVHGANRLASNSLLEGLVFSHNAFVHSAQYIKTIKDSDMPEYPVWNKEGTFDLQEWIVVQHNMEDVKRTMWDYVGIVRNDMRLKSAAKRISMLAEEIHNFYRKSTITPEIVELRNLATVSKLIIRSAIARKDSIGLHFNSDHPAASRKKKNVILEVGRRAKLKRLDELNF